MRLACLWFSLAAHGAVGLIVRRRALPLIAATTIAATTLAVPNCGALSLTQSSLDEVDVFFPAALVGKWQVTLKRTLVEGDAAAAEAAWRGLGGSGSFRALTESYETRFVTGGGTSPKLAAIVDREFELDSRLGVGSVESWARDAPGVISFARGGGMRVVQRNAEQAESGFGFTEYIVLTDGTGFERVARVQRRLRTATGGIDGLEIVKTYRLLDGVASDLPTSTTKTRIRYDRL